MIQCYRIAVRPKFSRRDLTIELYGCDLKCRYCCTAYGRVLPPRYEGLDVILEKALAIARRRAPKLIRLTGGEFALWGREAMDLYCRLASALEIPLVIETHLLRIGFFEEFAKVVQQSGVRPPIFIVSVKDERHVLAGAYRTADVIANVRRLYHLFPNSHIAHGLIGFNRPFREVLFQHFPELAEQEEWIHLEKEGRFTFEALPVTSGNRTLYYFEQKVKRYSAGPEAAGLMSIRNKGLPHTSFQRIQASSPSHRPPGAEV
jgi:hypothetical protein